MKNNIAKATILCSTLLVLIGLVLSYITSASFVSVGIDKITCTDDLQSLSIGLDYIWGADNSEEAIVNDLINNKERYIDELRSSDGIFVIEPTGAITQYRGSYSQTAKIINIAKCPKDYVQTDNIITIYQNGGFTETSAEIVFNQATNIMYPMQHYLVFLDESELNQISHANEYYFHPSIFSCIKLTEREKQSPCGFDFNAGQDSMQFCATSTVLSTFEDLEKSAIEKYNNYDE